MMILIVCAEEKMRVDIDTTSALSPGRVAFYFLFLPLKTSFTFPKFFFLFLTCTPLDCL